MQENKQYKQWSPNQLSAKPLSQRTSSMKLSDSEQILKLSISSLIIKK